MTNTEQAVKTLLLMRHAKSSWDNPGQDDHDRPLNPRGRGDAPRMGLLLIDQSLVPDSITASTAVRAQQTAQLMAQTLQFTQPILSTAELYHADPAAWRTVIRHLPATSERALCIGHNPGIEMLLSELTGESHHMSTAALAAIELQIDDWAELSLTKSFHRWKLWRPKDLPDIAADG